MEAFSNQYIEFIQSTSSLLEFHPDIYNKFKGICCLDYIIFILGQISRIYEIS